MDKLHKHDQNIILTCVSEKIRDTVLKNDKNLFETHKKLTLLEVRERLHINYKLLRDMNNLKRAINPPLEVD